MTDLALPTDTAPTEATLQGHEDTLASARATLATCRNRVEAFETGQARSNRALYEALEAALRLDRQLASDPKARRTVLRENGVKSARKGANPFTTVVKLAFGDADRARVNKYATVLAHAAETCPNDAKVADWLDHPERGIENSVKAWRACHRKGSRRLTAAEAEELARQKLAGTAAIDLEHCEPLLRHVAPGEMFLAIGRKTADGSLAVVHIPDDDEGRDLKRLLARLGGASDFPARVVAGEIEKLAMRRTAWRREDLGALDGLITRAERDALEARLDEAALFRARRNALPSGLAPSKLPSFLRPAGDRRDREEGASPSNADADHLAAERHAEELRQGVEALKRKLGTEAAFRRHVARLFERFDVDARPWGDLDPQLRYALSLVRGGTLSERVWDVLTRAVQRQFLEEALPVYEQMAQRWPDSAAPSDHAIIRDTLLAIAEKRRSEGLPPTSTLVPAKQVLGSEPEAGRDEEAGASIPSFLIRPLRSAS